MAQQPRLAQSLAFQWPDFSSIDLSNLASIPPNTHTKKKPFPGSFKAKWCLLELWGREILESLLIFPAS